MHNNFDIIVIGGGHAGIEAACASAKMGCSVALVTMEKDGIGRMSCNPAIGGSAKGHLVREIDALGGMMGILADRTGIQFRMLNKSKGPAVWSPRSQNDRKIYSAAAVRLIESFSNITIVEDSVISIQEENKSVTGITTQNNGFIKAKAIVLCSGTFLNGKMHTGMTQTAGGRFGESPAVGVTESLIKMGFESGRLKTGTPPRLHKDSIDWSVLTEEGGDENPQPFSYSTPRNEFPYQPQVSCYITYTNSAVHKVLEKGFGDSPLFTGVIKGVGPRYCPSIEDKIVRFADKPRHQLFLEPEGLDSDLIYLNGFSTSLPAEIQIEALKQLPGLENVNMVRAGYAVEYDFFPPHQVDLTFETKLINGLYFAGQINGTSGYEEAAAQGLIAGINAAAKITGKREFVLKRSEAYIGVLADDLVNKSTEEPYRMFTSRAEHRLVLRQDNSDLRLSKYANEFGLISDETNDAIEAKRKAVAQCVSLFDTYKLRTEIINPILESKNTPTVEFSEYASKIIKRPEITVGDILPLIDKAKVSDTSFESFTPDVFQLAETEIKYEGYILRQHEFIAKVEKYDELRIPMDFNFLELTTLSTEGRERLQKIKPRSLGQASRISGVTHSDISILLVYLKK